MFLRSYQAYLLVNFLLKKLTLFSARIQHISRCYFLVDTTWRVDNIFWAIRFAYFNFCISSVHFSQKIELFRLRITVNAICFSSVMSRQPRFQDNIPSINLVRNQIYHRIERILLTSSKYGKHQFVMKN